MLLSTVLALAGIGLAYLMYHKKSIDPAKIAKSSGPIYGILSNRFYIDQIYQWIFDVIVMGFSYVCKWFDTYIIDVSSIASPTSPNGWRQAAQD